MFKLFTRDQINIEKWNDCINRSTQSIIYGLSWYLDIVSPNWKAYIREENGTYVSAFPFASNRKFMINYIYQPSFTQQLGLFSIDYRNESEDFMETLTLLCRKYNYIDYHLNTKNKDINDFGKFSFQKKLTHHLHLSNEYATTFKAYSENHKRNIKKSLSQNFKIKYSNNISFLITLFKKEVGNGLNNIKEADYKILLSLYKEASQRKMCHLIFSEGTNGEINAGALFLYYNNTIIYLFGASTKQGKENGAMSMIFNEVIQVNSGSPDRVLDFEGSDIESIARFYKGFGAKAVPYISLKLNTLPFFLKAIKK